MTNASSQSMAKDVFWYLLLMIMLYTSAVSLLTVVWQAISIWFPDLLFYSYVNSSEMMLSAMATLLIAWLVFLLMSWLINRDLLKIPSKQDLWVRRWLIHLTLFVAAITIIVDLFSLTGSFFSGELTIRFALKVLAVLVVAVAVFGYELWELRRDSKKKTRIPQMSGVVATLVVILWIVLGFMQTGSPWYQRSLRMDEQRVGDLQNIQWQLISYWQNKDTLPTTLDELEDPISGFLVPMDPNMDEAYEYRMIDELTFELCATFEQASLEDARNPAINVRFAGEPMETETWQHEAGETCFERTIDPDIYSIDSIYR